MPPSRAVTLVTGRAGFIGPHLVERVLALGQRVRVVDNLSTGKLDNLTAVLSDIESVSLKEGLERTWEWFAESYRPAAAGQRPAAIARV